MKQGGAGPRGREDNLVDIEIGPDRAEICADAIAFVCLEAVQGELVFLGVDRDGPQAEFRCCPHDPDRDLAPVGGPGACVVTLASP